MPEELAMIIGFTGTRNGMTEAQKETVRRLVRELQPTLAVHGDCVGADANFHAIVRVVAPECRIMICPGPDDSMRAFCDADMEMARKTHFARNRDIVNGSDLMIGTPYQMRECNSGGTWYTINYSRKVKRETRIVWPDGDELIVSRTPTRAGSGR